MRLVVISIAFPTSVKEVAPQFESAELSDQFLGSLNVAAFDSTYSYLVSYHKTAPL